MNRSREHADLLMTKAAQDEFALRKLLPDPESPDGVIGFHAQQAVEKMLKAVLSAHEVAYRRTHDLVELMDLARDNGISIPDDLEEARRLGPFAVELRYGDVPPEGEEPLDRAWAAGCVRSARDWAESVLREKGSSHMP